jgi:hypothetical protein
VKSAKTSMQCPTSQTRRKGRPALGGRQRLGVVFGLAPGVQHQHIPAALGRAAARRRGIRLEEVLPSEVELLLVASLLSALLGLEHEGAAFVEVDAPLGRRAVRLPERDGALEDVGIELGRHARRSGLTDAE